MPTYEDAPQPNKLYYAHKQKAFIYGIVAPCTNQQQLYLIDENNSLGPKTGNLEINFLLQYVKKKPLQNRILCLLQTVSYNTMFTGGLQRFRCGWIMQVNCLPIEIIQF